jgi:hypothetical protein
METSCVDDIEVLDVVRFAVDAGSGASQPRRVRRTVSFTRVG